MGTTTSGALNDPFAPGTVSSPRLRVLINGADPGTALEASVTDTNHFHASRFHCAFVLSPQGIGSAAWWNTQTIPVSVDIGLGFLAPGAPEGSITNWQSVLQGVIDRRSIDLVGNTFHVEGRDYTARLIDFKLQDAFPNLVSSEIVTKLAGMVSPSLTPNVTPTSLPVSRYYALEHDKVTLNQFSKQTTAWDLITTLARYEGFDAWVSGSTLNFMPPPAQGSPPYLVQWSPANTYGPAISNALKLSLERSDMLAKGIQVTVKSWHAKLGRGFAKAYPTASTATAAKAGTQNYIVIRPNLTEDQALQLAQQIYTEIIRNERVVNVTLAPDLILTTHVLAQLQGTNTDFDQVYYPYEVTRHLSADAFEMNATFKNQSEAATSAGASLGGGGTL